MRVQSELRWGAKGHAAVNSLATGAMSPDMPAFFAQAGDRLTMFGGQPDRWKIDGLPQLADSNVPDHYVDAELVPGQSYPATRSQFMESMVRQNAGAAGQVGWSMGFLPYRIAEGFEHLVADFALWRRETALHGVNSPLAQELADDAVATGGLLGHFCGDASQPLHTTVHHDGWNDKVEPNPDGFSTKPGVHFRFETGYVNKYVNVDDVAARMTPVSELQGDPLPLALSFIQTSHGFVRDVYQMDKDGKFGYQNPQATDLVEDRLAAGASFLRNMWTTAWRRSEAVVGNIHDPQ